MLQRQEGILNASSDGMDGMDGMAGERASQVVDKARHSRVYKGILERFDEDR
jgi:hypothetical protein